MTDLKETKKKPIITVEVIEEAFDWTEIDQLPSPKPTTPQDWIDFEKHL